MMGIIRAKQLLGIYLIPRIGPTGDTKEDQPGQRPVASTEQELQQRIAWFIAMRWVAIVGVLSTVLLAHFVLRLNAPLNHLLAIVGFIGIHNIACHAVLRSRFLLSSSVGLQRFANTQMALDLMSLTLLLHYSGGVENPFAFYFIFHIIIASILLSRRATYLQAMFALLLYNAMVTAENTDLVHHFHLSNFLPAELVHTPFVFAMQFVFTSTVLISVYMATSITQRLRSHEQRTLSLSIQLAEQNEKLQDAYQMLSHTQSLQTQYMRKVSHELRSPLAAIESMLNLIVSGVVTDEEKRRELTERSLNRVRTLLRMVNDLLTLLRSRDVKPQELLEKVDLANVAQRVLDLLSARAEQEKVILRSDIQTAMAPVLGDPEKIETLLTNLIANAIKYTPEGGEVALRISQTSTEALIEVSDTGIGIDKEDLPRIFGEFYRSKRGRDFAPVGTGLGLSIVKSIVDAHRGTIHVESEVGRGTTFRVRLPRGMEEHSLSALHVNLPP